MSAQNCNVTYYEQGGVADRVRIDMVCQYVPLNTLVSFHAVNTDPPVSLPPTKVTTYPDFIAGVTVDLPADYKSEIIYCWELPPGVSPPVNMSITIEASIVVNG